MPKAFFFKEIASNAFIVAGKPVQFQPLPGNRGLLELESPQDDALIAALSEAAGRHVGGIVQISEAEAAQKKSLALSQPLQPPRRRELLRVMPKGPFNRKPAPGATAAPANGAPVAPRPDTVPLTRAAVQQSSPASDAAADVISQLASGAGTPPPIPSAPVEGFRPATRRISRKAAKDSVPAA